MGEVLIFVTSSLIGWKLAQQLIEKQPSLFALTTLSWKLHVTSFDLVASLHLMGKGYSRDLIAMSNTSWMGPQPLLTLRVCHRSYSDGVGEPHICIWCGFPITHELFLSATVHNVCSDRAHMLTTVVMVQCHGERGGGEVGQGRCYYRENMILLLTVWWMEIRGCSMCSRSHDTCFDMALYLGPFSINGWARSQLKRENILCT